MKCALYDNDPKKNLAQASTKAPYTFDVYKDALHVEMQKKIIDAIKNYHVSDPKWIEIKDTHIANLIMKFYGDKINRKILNCVIHSPKTVMEILQECKISQTTCYRKILVLIKNQFLVHYDTVRRYGSKPAPRYISAIRGLQIEINDSDNATVKAVFSSNVFSPK